MTDEQKVYFNSICASLQQRGLLDAFCRNLHEIVFPGKTHMGSFNMTWAIETSNPGQWRLAIDQTITESYEQDVSTAP